MSLAWLILGVAWGASDDAPLLEIEVTEKARTGDGVDPQHTSAAVTVIEVDERLPASSTVAQVVDRAAGVDVQSLGGLGDWSAVSIRGSTLRQVQVSIDGVPLNPDGAGTVDLSELPLWAFSRVEVYRGNAPAQLASAPMGGVVDLRTGDGEVSTKVGLTGAGGSYRTGRLGAVVAAPFTLRHTPGDVLAFADGFSTAGSFAYFDNNGTAYNMLDDSIVDRSNNNKAQLNAHGRVRLGVPNRRLSLIQSFLERHEGLPGHSASATTAASLATRRSLSVVQADGTRGVAKGTARAWSLLRRELLEDPKGEIGTGSGTSEQHFATVGLLLHGQRALGPNVVPGLTTAVRTDRHVAGADDNDPAQRISVTAAASGDGHLWDGRITLSAVAQALSLHDAVGEAGDHLLAFTPRGGVLVNPVPWLALKANAGRYLRPPDFTELFGDRGAVIGNPDLEPERGVQWDVGARLISPEHWTTQLSLDGGHFWNASTGLIVLVQNAQRTMVPLNLDDAWVQGWEGALSIVHPWVDSQTSLTRTTSVNLSDKEQYANNQLPRVPALEVQQLTALVWQDRVRLGHSLSHTASNYWDRTNFYEAPPRTLHGVFLRASPGPRWPELNIDVHNIFDRTTQVVDRNPLDPSDTSRMVQPITDFVGYPLAGRTLMVTLRWQHIPAPAAEASPR